MAETKEKTAPHINPLNRPWHLPEYSQEKPEVTVKPEQIINRQGKDFVLWTGLLDAAHRAGLQSIRTTLIQAPSDLNGQTCICYAEASFLWGAYSGIGDANPGNVGRMIAPHIIRMAETRAKARALRDALNVGMVAMEEVVLDDNDAPAKPHFNDEGNAAPRRVGKTAPAADPGPLHATATVEAEVAKFNRMRATAARLRHAGDLKADEQTWSPLVAPFPEGVSAEAVAARYQKLLVLVNAALNKPKGGNGREAF